MTRFAELGLRSERRFAELSMKWHASQNWHASQYWLHDTKLGIFTPNIEEARLGELMIEISKEVIVLVDSSKFKKRSLAFICKIDQIDKVITDSNISDEDKKRLEDGGVEVIIVWVFLFEFQITILSLIK